MTINFPNLTPIEQRIVDYLPKYYRENAIVLNLLEQEAVELRNLDNEAQSVLNQFFVDTATWGLSRWENLCGIPVDENKDIAIRRGAIKSRLRGQGTSTIALIKSVSEAYLNGECEVVERNSTYEVDITFIGSRGLPTNMEEIEKAINSIIPAHLKANFILTFLSWRELENAGISWAEAETKEDGITPRTWAEFEVGFL